MLLYQNGGIASDSFSRVFPERTRSVQSDTAAAQAWPESPLEAILLPDHLAP